MARSTAINMSSVSMAIVHGPLCYNTAAITHKHFIAPDHHSAGWQRYNCTGPHIL